MGSKGTGIVKRYWRPGLLIASAGTAGILIEDYVRSQGGSCAAYIKETVADGARTLGPAIGDIMDEVGKSVVHYVASNPSGAIMGGMGVIGAVLIGLKEGYIKNPFVKS